ncbi:hypothetical protein [uncultured Paraglaciecola sp.]|uniref:hypothetical protein n=1 Tax=uncultured Paraglaciecola sp. TaxID=1765024 RepID=UPI002618D0AB|nr:hypothetical protein [uncultured Paraglaciecola sp.]
MAGKSNENEGLKRLAAGLDAVNDRRKVKGDNRDAYEDLLVLLEHSNSVDEVMTTVRSFTVVGRILRKFLIWSVSTVGVTIAFVSFLKGGVGWLVTWATKLNP